MLLRFNCVVSIWSILFDCLVKLLCPTLTHPQFIPSPISGHLGCFQFKVCLSPFGLLSQNTVGWVAYKPQFIAHSSGHWELKDQAPADLVLVGSASWFKDSHVFNVFSDGGRNKGVPCLGSLL